MNMIRHNHIPANKPRTGPLPGIDNNGSAIGECENALAILAANREVNNHRLIVSFNYWRVRQMFATYVRFSSHFGIRRAISKVWAPTKRRPPWKQECKSRSSFESTLEGHALSRPKPLGVDSAVSSLSIKVEFRSASHRPLTTKSPLSRNQSRQCSLQSSRASDELVPMH